MNILFIKILRQLGQSVTDKKLIVCNNTPAEFCSAIIKVGWVERSETRHNGGCHFVLPYESKKESFKL